MDESNQKGVNCEGEEVGFWHSILHNNQEGYLTTLIVCKHDRSEVLALNAENRLPSLAPVRKYPSSY